jgi:hypothetical protein
MRSASRSLEVRRFFLVLRSFANLANRIMLTDKDVDTSSSNSMR